MRSFLSLNFRSKGSKYHGKRLDTSSSWKTNWKVEGEDVEELEREKEREREIEEEKERKGAVWAFGPRCAKMQG